MRRQRAAQLWRLGNAIDAARIFRRPVVGVAREVILLHQIDFDLLNHAADRRGDRLARGARRWNQEIYGFDKLIVFARGRTLAGLDAFGLEMHGVFIHG